MDLFMSYDLVARGRFKPKFPAKYKGDVDNIFFRSSWERKIMKRLDEDSNVIEWSSEEVVVPYISPIDGRYHRYFVDFKVTVRTKHGTIKTELWEVKPASQTVEPAKRKRITKAYINEVVRYGINEAKWKAATEYALDRGWKFRVLTEHELGITL
jgi:hypothetical protein